MDGLLACQFRGCLVLKTPPPLTELLVPSWPTCVSCPRDRTCLRSLCASLQKTQQRSLSVFVPWRMWHCLCAVPTTWRWDWDQSKEKPKRVPDSMAFSSRTLLQALEISFLLKVQFLSMRLQLCATRKDANLNREIETTLQDCRLPLRTSWRIVTYLIRGPTPKKPGCVGYKGLQHQRPSGGSGPRARERLM